MSTAQTLKPMHVRIKGRIENSSTHDGFRYTQILTPAADQYSKPDYVEVKSKSPFGSKGDEVDLMATLGGYKRRSENKDRSTGEITKKDFVNMFLTAVE